MKARVENDLGVAGVCWELDSYANKSYYTLPGRLLE